MKLKKLKDLVVDDQFNYCCGTYKVTEVFESQLLAIVTSRSDTCYRLFSRTDEAVELVDELGLTGKDLLLGDKFFWKPQTSGVVREVVHVEEDYLVYKFTQTNGRTHYNVIYAGESGWNREVTLCE